MKRINTIKYAVGTVHRVRDGELTITKYIDYNRREVRFTDPPYTTVAGVRSIRAGQVKNRMKVSVYGVGYLGDESILSHPPLEKEIQLWRNRIALCYHSKGKHYGKVTVDPEWHSRANFIAWLRGQPNYQEWLNGKLDLDRNIKSTEPNPPYSPKNCVLVDSSLNRSLGDKAVQENLKTMRPQRPRINIEGMKLT